MMLGEFEFLFAFIKEMLDFLQMLISTQVKCWVKVKTRRCDILPKVGGLEAQDIYSHRIPCGAFIGQSSTLMFSL